MIERAFPTRIPDRPVVVVGAAGIDMIGILKEEAQDRRSNPATIRISFGGVGRNVAENLARLGQPARLITAVGQDPLGNDLLAQTAACGVDVEACKACSTSGTPAYLVVMQSDGARRLALEDMTALETLTPSFIQEHRALINESAMLFLDANIPEKTLRTVFRLAGKARVPICADATSVLLAGKLEPYLENLYMITANSSEASALCHNEPTVVDQTTALQAARQLVNRGVELAVVTLAEFGVVYATSETSGHIPAIRTSVLDPTGAGDALTATVIFGLLNDIPIDEAVRLGVTAASLILRYRGTVLPGLSLEKLYDELVM